MPTAYSAARDSEILRRTSKVGEKGLGRRIDARIVRRPRGNDESALQHGRCDGVDARRVTAKRERRRARPHGSTSTMPRATLRSPSAIAHAIAPSMSDAATGRPLRARRARDARRAAHRRPRFAATSPCDTRDVRRASSARYHVACRAAARSPRSRRGRSPSTSCAYQRGTCRCRRRRRAPRSAAAELEQTRATSARDGALRSARRSRRGPLSTSGSAATSTPTGIQRAPTRSASATAPIPAHAPHAQKPSTKK